MPRSEKKPRIKMDMEQQRQKKIIEESSGEVFNEDTKKIDFRKLRVTDIFSDQRMELPRSIPQDEERILMAKELMWEDTIMTYSRNN